MGDNESVHTYEGGEGGKKIVFIVQRDAAILCFFGFNFYIKLAFLFANKSGYATFFINISINIMCMTKNIKI